MQTILLSTSDPAAIDRALSVLQNGGLVAFPTDTVYGLAAATFSAAAVERLFEAKTRAATKAIAVLVGEITHLRQLTPGLTDSARMLAERFWPGALTLIVPKSPKLPENLSVYPTIGVRMPDHPFALALLRRVGPLATTSANLSGAANPLTAQDVLDQLDGRIDLLLDGGPCPGGVPSTVVDCTQDPPVLLREGSLSPDSIHAALHMDGPAHKMSAVPLLELRGATVQRGSSVLLNTVDWTIQAGQQWIVTGPNGSGKTSLMQVLQGKVPIFPGEIHFASPEFSSRIAQVSFEQAQHILAREQELEFSRSFSGSEDEGTRVATFLESADAGILARFNLEALRNAPLSTLSNGEMRKVLLARALQANPRLLILDEPFDGLDSASRATLASIIRRVAESGTQIILVTHHSDEITAPFTHLLRLEAGRVVFQGPRPAFHPSPQPELAHPAPYIPPPLPPAPLAPPVIEMRDIRIAYGQRVIIEGLQWTARRNENWAVVGPNGAGKTTLLRLISADHLQAYANDITLFGRSRGSGESIWEIKQRIGVLSPELQIHYRQDLAVGEVVLSGFFDSVGLYRRATPEQHAQAAGWLDLLSLDVSTAYAALSYGQKRVVLLARALVKNPDLLLLDEPCQGLDPANCRRLVELVSQVAERRATQIIYVTHRREELPRCITHLLEFHLAGERYTVTQTAVSAG